MVYNNKTIVFVYREYNDENVGGMIIKVFPSGEEVSDYLKSRLSEYFGRPVNDVMDLLDVFSECDILSPNYVSYDTGHGVCHWIIEPGAFENTPNDIFLAYASVNTSMGKLIATAGGEDGYPGIEISILPEGKEQPIVLALAEIVEGDRDNNDNPRFHLRPYVGKYPNMADENGYQISGKISAEAPMDDIAFTAEDLAEYCDQFKKEPSESREKFEKRYYEAYQLDWMLSHGCRLSDLDDIIGLMAEAIDEDLFQVPTGSGDMIGLADAAKDRFFNEVGFAGGRMFVCMDEFLGAEFLDPDYMAHLFDATNAPASDREFYKTEILGET